MADMLALGFLAISLLANHKFSPAKAVATLAWNYYLPSLRLPLSYRSNHFIIASGSSCTESEIAALHSAVASANVEIVPFLANFS